jgi:hypothetical protein
MVSYEENVCKRKPVMQYASQDYMTTTTKKIETRNMCTTFTYKANISKLPKLI